MNPVPRLVRVACRGDIEDGKALLVEAGGEEVSLFRVDGVYYALANNCTHREGPLCEGLIEGTTVTCPWHFGKFDLRTGAAIGAPASEAVRRYEVQVEGDEIMIALP
jgi:nitrite reductase/ring-hydroxylating ferredoxin subunit